MTQLISIIAGLFNLTAGAKYLIQIGKNESTPNPTTWFVVMVVTIINSATYFGVVQENHWLALSSVVTSIMVSLIFITSLFKRKFTKPNLVDGVSLIICIIAGILWQTSDSAIISNIFLQTVFVISFYPTIHGLIIGTSKENHVSWILGCCSYVLQIVNVLLTPVTLWALVFPVIQLMGQGAIMFLAYHKNSSNILH